MALNVLNGSRKKIEIVILPLSTEIPANNMLPSKFNRYVDVPFISFLISALSSAERAAQIGNAIITSAGFIQLYQLDRWQRCNWHPVRPPPRRIWPGIVPADNRSCDYGLLADFNGRY